MIHARWRTALTTSCSRHVRPSLLMVAMTVAFAACSGSDSSPADTSRDSTGATATAQGPAADRTRPRAVFAAFTPPPAAAPPEKLKKHPKDDLAEWKRYRNKLSVLGPTDDHGRQCLGLGDVEDERCRITISPVRDARWIPWNALDELGFIVARLHNVGTLPEVVFGIANKQVVYWRVYRRAFTLPDGTTEQRMMSQFIDRDSGMPIARPDHPNWDSLEDGYALDEFPLKLCHQAPAPGDAVKTHARLTTCSQATAAHVGVQPADTSAFVNRHNSPAWITCVQGCCAVEGGP